MKRITVNISSNKTPDYRLATMGTKEIEELASISPNGRKVMRTREIPVIVAIEGRPSPISLHNPVEVGKQYLFSFDPPQTFHRTLTEEEAIEVFEIQFRRDLEPWRGRLKNWMIGQWATRGELLTVTVTAIQKDGRITVEYDVHGERRTIRSHINNIVASAPETT